MLKRNLIPIIILLIIFAFVIQPETVSEGAFRGLNIWIDNIVPFLFPMFILSNILLQYNFIYSLLERFSFISLLVLKSKLALIPYFISVVSGYPSGALITDIMAENKKTGSQEANYIVTFTNNCSFQFIYAVVAFSMLGNIEAAKYIAIPHYAGAILLSFLFFNSEPVSGPAKTRAKKTARFNEIFSSSVYKSIMSILTVGGVIVFFSVFSQFIIEFLSSNPFFMSLNANVKDIIFSFLIGSLEVTNGCKIIAASAVPLEVKLVIINFLISFSGLSIIFQTIAVTNNFNFNPVSYLKGRFILGIISSLICILMLIIL